MRSDPDIERLVAGVATVLATEIRDARRRRRWTIAQLADRAGVSAALVQWLEAGHAASVETYVRVARALGLRFEPAMTDPRRRSVGRGDDPVHAAIGEVVAGLLGPHGVGLALDEPYQHYQFAGRADLVAWTVDGRQLLHSEHRTRFPNIQEAFGSYNAKRRYLPGVMADRIGIRGGFASVTHLMICAWTSEAISVVRRHRASFQAVCPDVPAALTEWLAGRPPSSGVTSSLVFLDPASSGRQRLFVGLTELERLRPRHRGYADLAQLLETRRP